MKEINIKEIREHLEHAAAIGDSLTQDLTVKENEFDKTAEGREVIYLQDVIKHYLSDLEAFLGKFVSISQEHGKSGALRIAEILEHEDHGLKPDKKLVNYLEEFATRTAKSRAFNDYRFYVSYKSLLERLEDLKTETDIHDFIQKFNWILVDALKIEGSPIAELLKERKTKKGQKKLSRTIALERYEITLLLLKFMLSMLHFPEQKNTVHQLVGNADFSNIVEKLGRALNWSQADINEGKQQISEAFDTQGKNDPVQKLVVFSTAVKNHGKKFIFVRGLLESGKFAKEIAHDIMEFSVDGNKIKADPKLVKLIGFKLDQLSKPHVKAKIENDAKDEIGEMLTEFIKDMKKVWEKELASTKKIFEERIKAIRKQHEDELKELRHAKTVMTDLNTTMAEELLVIEQAAYSEQAIWHNFFDISEKIIDITSVRFGIDIVAGYAKGHLPAEELEFYFEKAIRPDRSQFVVQTLEKIQGVAKSFNSGSIKFETFRNYTLELEKFADSLMSKLHEMEAKMTEASEQLDKNDDNIIELKNRIIHDSTEADEKAHEYNKRVLRGRRAFDGNAALDINQHEFTE